MSAVVRDPKSATAGRNRTDLVACVSVALLTCGTLWPVRSAAFLNWDDEAVFLQNPALTGERAFAWAFTTTHMGHYQPLSWIVWAAVARLAGLSPASFHVLSLGTHAIATALVYLLTVRLLALTGIAGTRSRIVAAIAALFFGIHPMRVEPVAWASAFPYLAALVFALVSVLAYVASRSEPWVTTRWRRPTAGAVGWSIVAVATFVVSLGFRPIAVGLPLMLLLLDWYPLRSAHQQTGRNRLVPLVADKIPYALIAAVAVGLEWFARRQVGFNELTPAARMTLAATAPFVYLWRTIAPFALSPVSVLPLNVEGSITGVVCATGIGAITAAGWGLRDRRPAVLALWIGYLLLVAPTAGLAPTGLQAVADRYAYLPAIAIAIAAAAATSEFVNRRLVVAAAGAVLFGLSVMARNQTSVWQDSVTLWTRAAELDPANDVAFYNLGTALQAAGRSDDAMKAYEATLRLVPDHVPARHNLDGLRAIAYQREADALAEGGNFAGAIPLYRETLALDPRRSRARAALGIALTRTGQFEPAADELTRAIDEGVEDPAVVNAAGYALVQTGRTAEAITLLRDAVARHPDDPGLAHNLELLLDAKTR